MPRRAIIFHDFGSAPAWWKSYPLQSDVISQAGSGTAALYRLKTAQSFSQLWPEGHRDAFCDSYEFPWLCQKKGSIFAVLLQFRDFPWPKTFIVDQKWPSTTREQMFHY